MSQWPPALANELSLSGRSSSIEQPGELHVHRGGQERRGHPGLGQDLERAGLDRGRARLAVRLGLALHQPDGHPVPGQLHRRQQARRTRPHHQYLGPRPHDQPPWSRFSLP